MSTARSRRAAPAALAEPLRSFALRARVVASVGTGQYDALRASLAALLGAHALQLDGAWAPR